ncbi:MAG: threonine/serine dehydratase [Alphaproteobacteria bacterium]
MTSFPVSDDAPTIGDIEAAALTLNGKAVWTPLLESPLLNQRLGGRLLVKPECLQRTGSFKFRGAFNRISNLSKQETAGGVIAYSSGNHAQGVAAAAGVLGLPAVIVMPEDAPAIKIRNTRALGAEVVTYDRFGEDREAIADRIAAERGAAIVRPYDDPYIIAGQGTVGLEIAEDLEKLGVMADAVLAPCGGGGLISGTATALAAKCPDTPVYAVEPAEFDDTRRSLESGERQGNADGLSSICDALLSKMPGKLTFPINRALLAGAFGISDEQALAAMAVAFADLKLVVEPGGAVALAACLNGMVPLQGQCVVAVLSGGNVDPAMFRRALEISLA